MHAERCEQFRRVATASARATQQAKAGLAQQQQYLGLLSQALEKTSSRLVTTQGQRDAMKIRVGRFEKIVDGAKKELASLC